MSRTSFAMGKATSRVSPHGGAIAHGHPPGMPAARLALPTLNAMKMSGHKRTIVSVSLCIGVGQGSSALVGQV